LENTVNELPAGSTESGDFRRSVIDPVRYWRRGLLPHSV